MSPAIKMVTGGVLMMLAVILAFSLKAWPMLVGVALLVAVVLGCYLRSPVAYDLTGDQLTVRFRMGEKVFAPVTRCSLLSSRPPWGYVSGATGGCSRPRAFSGTRPTESTGPMSRAPVTKTTSWLRPQARKS
jgi:hypothetical protein